MTQTDAILKHLLKHKTITSIQAIKRYGITRLAARIKELKDDGKKIGGYLVKVKTRYGSAQVMRYYLA